nr:TSC complex subunit 1a isoform X1 [Nothobranchius furzeri]
MSKEQVSISELLLSLDSSELQEAERVRAAVNKQLATDRGGAVLLSLVEYYLDSFSSQAVLLLSSIREPHHKVLLEKLNDSLSRSRTRLAAVTLLGHLIRKQPPWVHHISQSVLLSSLLRCLKTDSDVVVLITGVLVLITLLPMIPQAGKQHIYDFFDVFGRLASWSNKNPGHVPLVYLVHLHAGVYSLFHRLYGMFPCNFMSYLRLHYSMKENLDTFQEVVKPMLEHVRVHPELVTGTQDYELDPSRWRSFEVHDIMIECSKVSLDPLESSCEEDFYYPSRVLPRPPPMSSPAPHLDLGSTPCDFEPFSSSEHLVGALQSGNRPVLTLENSHTLADDVTWSPSSRCGLSTPPPEPTVIGSTPSLSRCSSFSGVKYPLAPPTEDNQQHSAGLQVTQQPIRVQEVNDVINNSQDSAADIGPPPPTASSSAKHLLLTSTPAHDESSSSLPPACSASFCFTPSHLSSHRSREGTALSDIGPTPLYESLFELALPRATMLFTSKKTQEVLQRTAGEEGEEEEQQSSISPLKALDQMILHGNEAHERLSRRFSAANKSLDRSSFGGKQIGMRSKGPSQGEELQTLRSQLLLVHSQLQYERFKRQQHAIRNRRLLRRVISATVLEEYSVAMKAQLGVQDEEIQSLKTSLDQEQRRYVDLKQDMKMQTDQLHSQIQQLLLQQEHKQQLVQKLQSELHECQSRLRDLEAELQKTNHKAYNAEHQLTQLSVKLCSSEQLQQQMFLLNQQLILLRDTNRALQEQLEAGDAHVWTEETMLQGTVGKEFQKLQDRDIQQKQRLEAANHRIAELENQLAKKEKLILDQKKLLEDTKIRSRAEMSASESRCVALRTVAQNLQTEMLHLYGQVHLDTKTGSDPSSVLQDTSSRPVSDSISSPVPHGSNKSRPSSSSAVGIINGTVKGLSCSPLSVSPIDSPLAVGSFLEQQARRLFGPSGQSPEEELQEEEEEEVVEEEEATQPESPPLGQEVEEATPLTGSPQMELLSRVVTADLAPAVRQRRDELSIMDYNESLPEL